MGIGGVGQAAVSEALSSAAGDNPAVGITMLRRSLDVSQSSAAQLLSSLPDPSRTLGSAIDIRV